MSILSVLVLIVVTGVVLWCINAYVPMAAPVKKLLNVVVVVGLVIWLLWAFGVLDYLGAVQLPHGHHLRR